ncbi:flavin-containing monooxygenase [Scheffersomyces coipomensis]|uniref:flavin-containing monooxygenase n=1 Tax=Scheffersomyces coipomensis TaxID=1788519 RepID=UPI00315C6E71
MTKLDIESIAIIGAGPGGLASLYEFLHTNQDGTSTVGEHQSTNPKFKKIVAFEQKDKAGGIWSAQPTFEPDLAIPPQDLLDTEKYNDPSVIHPLPKIPTGLEHATFEKPVEVKEDKLSNELEWKASGIFPDLFTNIPSRFTRFSYLDNEPEYLDEKRIIYPFLHHQEQTGRLEKFIKNEKLYDHIRVNSTVEQATKTSDGKWLLTVRQKDTTNHKEHWYTEKFDAIVISNGHYTVPNIPHIDGLAQFNKNFPGVLNHTKNYRNQDEYKDKKVLIVGGSISTVNILQYVVPVAKQVINSKRGPHYVFEWINDGLVSKGIEPKGTIKKIDPVSGEFFFEDGSSEQGFDKIILTTGYHYHYPFLNHEDGGVKVINPSNLSRVGGLYYDTFSVEDPTLATVGVAVSPLNFHTIEASAAAVAGVWSGKKTLPTKQEQLQWEQVQIKKTADNLFFHYYTHKKKDEPHLVEIELGVNNLEKLYYGLKDGTLPKSKTVLQS